MATRLFLAVAVALVGLPEIAMARVQERSAPGVTEPGPHVDLALTLGAFMDYPDQFSPGFCTDEQMVGASAAATYRPLSWLGIEGGVTVSRAVGWQVCEFVTLGPLPIGEPVTRSDYPDGLGGPSFFATTVAALVEPFHESDVSPRARLGVGRLWDSELGTWLWALGVRYRFGRHSLIMEVEQWHLEIDRTQQIVVYQMDGSVDVLSSEIIPELARAAQIRIGWEIDLGR